MQHRAAWGDSRPTVKTADCTNRRGIACAAWFVAPWRHSSRPGPRSSHRARDRAATVYGDLADTRITQGHRTHEASNSAGPACGARLRCGDAPAHAQLRADTVAPRSGRRFDAAVRAI